MRVRPPGGLGHYLRDVVYGASDGVVTTLAVVAGVSGASLPSRVAVILGLANLAADGLSMGASNYLGLRSELEQTGASIDAEQPVRHGLATMLAFVVAGAVPLVAYLVQPAGGALGAAVVLSAMVLAALGAMRARMVGRRVWRGAVETVLIGGAAGIAAYGVGVLGKQSLQP